MATLSFRVPDPKRIRLLIDTDAKNEADDQYAIVHALLTPRFINRGIIAAHFGTRRTTASMEESHAEAKRLTELLGSDVPVYKGAPHALPDERTPVPSEGAEAIIREALADDPHPLFAIFLGPLTDLAAAYLMEPRIADRLTAVWIGGGPYPDGGREYNLANDVHAANVIMDSPVSLWQIPQDVFTRVKIGLAELEHKVKPCGEIGKYLFGQLVRYNEEQAHGWPKGESWILGDSPAVGVLLDDHEFGYEEKPAPRFSPDMHYIHRRSGRKIRVYHYIDARFTLEDLFAKLALYAENGE